ncbi:hypothetical protein UFOVP1608_2 [uncultured Caudovirales phage]|uniref:Uncharacterized protein n=1 Tax=uncultured Caudovirales phage TaxID=2100421 RepID=A0A6J5SS04_9CAUD|nr:hypothetical protein UFOVP1608_2 [uncultured Caudovirales phage]
MKRLSPCPRCSKSVRIFTYIVEGEPNPYEVSCEPFPTLAGIFRLVDLVSNRVELADPSTGQFVAHVCGGTQ